MGLDMYLTAERYVSGYDFREEKERTAYRTIVDAAGLGEAADPGTPSLTVEVTVAYWRKANQIHAWFVENVQGGEDECREHEVSREQLRELRDLCADVLARSTLVPGKVYAGTTYSAGEKTEHWNDGQVISDPSYAAERLPSQSGFFFGGTDYDEHYVSDLRSTIKQIDRALSLGDVTFHYQSSW